MLTKDTKKKKEKENVFCSQGFFEFNPISAKDIHLIIFKY